MSSLVETDEGVKMLFNSCISGVDRTVMRGRGKSCATASREGDKHVVMKLRRAVTVKRGVASEKNIEKECVELKTEEGDDGTNDL